MIKFFFFVFVLVGIICCFCSDHDSESSCIDHCMCNWSLNQSACYEACPRDESCVHNTSHHCFNSQILLIIFLVAGALFGCAVLIGCCIYWYIFPWQKQSNVYKKETCYGTQLSERHVLPLDVI